MRHALVTGAVAAAFAVLAVAPARASDQTPREVAAGLHWGSGTQHLATSNADFAVPASGRMVTGADAAKMDEAINGADASDTEGYAELKDGSSLYMEYSESGFVSTGDFSKIDPVAMMVDIRKQTEDANDERRTHGIPGLHVDGWVLKPTLDRRTAAARFVIADHDDRGHHLVNAVALVLGRRGYERFTLATEPRDTPAMLAELDALTKAYHYVPGARFTDYVSGDKLADVGIAALVSTAAGVTIAKTVGFGAIVALLVKFKLLIIAAVAGFAGRIRGLFSRERETVPSMPQSSPFENPPPPSLNP